MRSRLVTLSWVLVVVAESPASAAELNIGGLKLSDPQFQTTVEVYLADVPGVLGVTARAADGTDGTLAPAGPASQFFLFLDPVATFDEFRTRTVGNWQLAIEFSGGNAVYDFIVNDFSTPFTEAAFPPAPTMLSPTDGETGVSPSPTFMWDPGGAHTLPLESLFVNVYSLADPAIGAIEGSFGGPSWTLASTEWTPPIVLPPGPAMFLVQYETNGNEDTFVSDPVFNAAASTVADPGVVWEYTTGDLFGRDLIFFTVVPEPTTWALLIISASVSSRFQRRLHRSLDRRR